MNRWIAEQEELGDGLQFDGVDPRGRDGQELLSSLKKRPPTELPRNTNWMKYCVNRSASP